MSSSNGLDFKAVLQSFAGCEIPMPDSGRWASAGMVRGGRCDIAWRILDAQHWGVPQRRRRIFFVADFRGQRAAEVLFKPESLRRDFTQGGTQGQETAGRAGNGVEDATAYAINGNTIGRKPKNGGNGLGVQENISPTLTSIDRHAVFDCRGNDDGIILFEPRSQDGVPRIHNSVCPTLNTAQGGQRQPCIIRMRSGCEGGGKGALVSINRSLTLTGHNDQTLIYCPKTARTLKAKWCLDHREDSDTLLCVSTGQGNAEICENIAPTLNCNHEQPYVAGHIVRRLTPMECERLQGFPDNWTAYGHDEKPISDTKRYTAIGNSVAVPCVDYIMQGIIDLTPMTGK